MKTALKKRWDRALDIGKLQQQLKIHPNGTFWCRSQSPETPHLGYDGKLKRRSDGKIILLSCDCDDYRSLKATLDEAKKRSDQRTIAQLPMHNGCVWCKHGLAAGFAVQTFDVGLPVSWFEMNIAAADSIILANNGVSIWIGGSQHVYPMAKLPSPYTDNETRVRGLIGHLGFSVNENTASRPGSPWAGGIHA
ncbi:MAG TPA: hypothetical protein VMW58_01840 [Anaerolineae bacterium]|nr:hypothetical protein [Anaerolineae bacterium]